MENSNHIYLCIDLKSFFASVECVLRGLDSMTTNLVVADASRGGGGICLAVSPSLKQRGVRNRCRLYEIPEGMDYIIAVPRMKKYMEYSCMVYGVYLKYIAKEDILVYSIDECFLDVTHYLKLYNTDVITLAKRIIKDVYDTTGICATAGIGTNMFLCKVALDITAKHVDDHIGYLDEELFRKEIWHHKPITDVWNVGPGTARRLLKYGVDDLYGVAHMDEEILYKEFGVNARYLIDHSHGIETVTIPEIKAYKPRNKSYSNSQILFEDYNYDDALLVLKEMVEVNVLDLIGDHVVTNSIGLYVGYSKDIIKGVHGTMKLDGYTSSFKELWKHFLDLYTRITDKNYSIRQLGVSFSGIMDEAYTTVDLLTDIEEVKKERRISEAILSIKNRYGKNSILKGMNLEEKATQQKRNKLIGGHNGE